MFGTGCILSRGFPFLSDSATLLPLCPFWCQILPLYVDLKRKSPIVSGEIGQSLSLGEGRGDLVTTLQSRFWFQVPWESSDGEVLQSGSSSLSAELTYFGGAFGP